MGAFYALLAAVVITLLAVLITFTVLVATGGYTGTFRRGQAKPKPTAPPQQ